MNPHDTLENLFKKFPGIGARQARRFVYFLLGQDQEYLDRLANSIRELKKDSWACTLCQRFFYGNTETHVCDVCGSPNTDTRTLLVVEKDVDFENIRKTNVYRGMFFVLGGTIPLLENNPKEKVRITQLLERIKKGLEKDLREVILAFSLNPEGENTTQYVKKTLEPLAQKHGIKITTLGRGLSTGTELEYSDSETLKSALGNRF